MADTLHACLDVTESWLRPTGLKPKLAAVRALRWPRPAQGPTRLRVRFLEGKDQVEDKVKAIATTWSKYAYVVFDFVSAGDAEIRIAFNLPGSWSRLGTDACAQPQDAPTMNFGWLDPDTSDDEYERVVLHEFGHALGCIHEHSSPAATIPWNREAVYAAYAGPPNHWTRRQVDHNVFATYSAEVTQFTKFDRTSIMLYPIPAAFVTDPTFAVGLNRALSSMDKNFVKHLYPVL